MLDTQGVRSSNLLVPTIKQPSREAQASLLYLKTFHDAAHCFYTESVPTSDECFSGLMVLGKELSLCVSK